MEDERNVQYQAYLQERKASIQSEQSEAATYDRWLITLASGAFGLSITFYKDIAGGDPLPETLKFIVSAWAFLCISITLTMVSLQASQHAFRRSVDILDQQYESDQPDEVGKANVWDTVVCVLNWGSLLFFILGVALLAYFCFSNSIR